MSHTAIPYKTPDADFLKLTRRFFPRRLVSRTDQAAAMAAIRDLAVIDEQKLSGGQRDYLETMAVLLEDFDRRHIGGAESLKGLALLTFLMREHGLSATSLAKKIGVSQSLMALVLAGDRSISLKLMVKLGDYFGLRPSAFFV